MKKIIFAFLAAGLSMLSTEAQNVTPSTINYSKDSTAAYQLQTRSKEYHLADLELEKDRVEKQEKFKLKQALTRINEKLEKKLITPEEAQKLKSDAAKEAALNIDNKLAIIENQKQLLERGSRWTFDYDGGKSLEIGIGNTYDDNGSTLFGFGYENRSKKIQYDKRTYTDVVIAGGNNNVVSNGHSLKDSPYKIWKSTFAELGFTFRTRLLKDSNFWRLAYGTSLQLHSFELTGNRIFTVDGENTGYQTFDENLKYQKLRITNLVFPAYLEFGNSKKIEQYDRMRYSTVTNWKFGVGGYAGLNAWNAQRLKYHDEGRKIDDTQRRSFNATNFVYGLGAYVGYGPISIYATYDLNPLFKNGPAKENVLSVALRLDL